MYVKCGWSDFGLAEITADETEAAQIPGDTSTGIQQPHVDQALQQPEEVVTVDTYSIAIQN